MPRFPSNDVCVLTGEFVKLADLPSLADLVFVGNPIEEKYSSEGSWIEEATKRLPKLKKLDGEFQCFEVHDQGFYLFIVFIYIEVCGVFFI